MTCKKIKRDTERSISISSSQDARNSILGCSMTTIGRIEATSISCVDQGRSSIRSAGHLVLFIKNSVSFGVDKEKYGASLVILESLIWPIVARRSIRIKEWFSSKELGRCISSFKKTFERICHYTSSDNREQVFVKYWLDYYMCQCFGDYQRPQKEQWIDQPLFSGWLRKFIARAISKKDLSLIYSLQKGSKRSWPVLGQEKKYASLLKHKERISNPHGFVPEDLSKMISYTSWSVFGWTSTGEKFVPSGKACLQATVNDGGALSMFEDLDFRAALESDLAAKIGKLRALSIELDSWRKRNYEESRRRVRESIENCGEDLFDLQVVAVPEPSKFRIITKGHGYLYTFLQPVQGILLDSWKNHYASTMLHEDLTMKVNKIHENVKLPYFCSVDYEAATDLLKKECTLDCIRPLKNLPNFEEVWLALSASGTVKYPKMKGFPDIEDAELCDGQLMGHPLSFPLLCVINLSVYYTAIDRWIMAAVSRTERRYRKSLRGLLRRNVIVNGDDMLFKCEGSFYEIFCKCAADAGLKLSQGKQYLSKDMCMINSQVFKLDTGKDRMMRCGYLNQKFFEAGSEVCEAQPDQFGKDLNKMIELCPWTKCVLPRVFSRFKITYQNDFEPNWYLPYHLGGFGIDLKYSPENWRVTRAQRKVARMFLKDPKLLLFRKDITKIPTDRFTENYGLSVKVNDCLKKTVQSETKLLFDLKGAFSKFQWKQPMRPLNDNETEEGDPWLERLMLIKRLSWLKHPGFQYSSFHYDRKILQSKKPLKFSNLIACWCLSMYRIKGPSVPPLQTLCKSS